MSTFLTNAKAELNKTSAGRDTIKQIERLTSAEQEKLLKDTRAYLSEYDVSYLKGC